ncbi:D-serine deaminase-like pyridoxal phosphate-dependent protein [Mumia flava]|uniref:D-serine deaminase-like pyridoxal phosphate-dependent protein n=1 Tax=Mumia flava TaxID=1348852 RepID=A0A2M9BF05_9ACTN|nr:alanine racemase [Mumia flava]PJJ56528.1 D-serine deaminase-like pyridoxal phosphate-dependent protein [Mumia flava]
MTASRDPAVDESFLDRVPLPVLVLRGQALEHNLAAMRDYSRRHDVELAPHVKTHLSPQLWRRQEAYGATACTLATVAQVRAMVEHAGVRRVLLANEVVAPGDLAALCRLRREHPDLEVMVFVDSTAAVGAMDRGLARSGADLGPLGVLVEVGPSGGRTGARGVDEARAVARAAAASERLQVVGVSGYEGVLASQGAVADRPRVVDAYLGDGETALRALLDADLVDRRPAILTFGGSDLYPAVVARLADAFDPDDVRVVLRSGCYVLHDHGLYARAQAAMPDGAGLPVFEPVLEVWGPVLSVPEPGRAVVGVGKRDASYDVEPPVPLRRRRDGQETALAELTVERLFDQHAILVGAGTRALAVGDLVAFGISHPCATMDRWRSAWIVDAAGDPVEEIVTLFG